MCALLGYYAASCGNCLPTFRDNVSVPSSRVNSPSRKEYVFQAVLDVCILGTLNSFTLFVPSLSHCDSTLLAVITPTDCYPAILSRIYVIGCWLSFLLELLTREDGTEMLSRNVSKQLPHDTA
jgi:hypothetical protein